MSFTKEQVKEIERIVDARMRLYQPGIRQTPQELRVSRGYHLVRHLSDACGVQPGTIRKYERGDLKREDELVHNAFEKIAAALGITKTTYAVAVRAMTDRKKTSRDG